MNRRIFLIAAALVVVLIPIVVFNFKVVKKRSLELRLRQEKANVQSSLAGLAKGLEAKGNIPEAKAAYQKLVNDFPSSTEILSWQKKVEELNLKMLFSSLQIPNKTAVYEIRPGDTLIKIAKDYKTTPELIMKCNRLASDKITPGRKVRIWTAPFNILVDKSQNILILKSDEDIIRTYLVSTGANNSSPVGTFKIINKLSNPTWFKAGAVVPAESPENILGSRWMGFDLPGYGIHGTTEPQHLGKQVTQGCVRMANSDVEELYGIIPTGTEVTIAD